MTIKPITLGEMKAKINDIWLGEKVVELSTDMIGNCVYTKEYNDVGCIIGSLLPDSIDRELIEGEKIQNILNGFRSHEKEIQEYFSLIDNAILIELQNLHDAIICNTKEKFRERLGEYLNTI